MCPCSLKKNAPGIIKKQNIIICYVCLFFLFEMLVTGLVAQAENKYKTVKKNKNKLESIIKGKNIGQDPFHFKTAELMYKSDPVRPFDRTAENLIEKIQKRLNSVTFADNDDNIISLIKALNPYRKSSKVQTVVKQWAEICSRHIRENHQKSSKSILSKAKKYVNDLLNSNSTKANDIYKSGDFEDAIKKYKSDLVQNPLNLDLRNNMALAHLHLANDLIAQFEFEIIRLLKPDYMPAAINLATVLERLGQSEKARKLVFEVNSRTKDFAIASFNASWYHNLNGDYRSALRILKPLYKMKIKEKYTSFYNINKDLLKNTKTKRNKRTSGSIAAEKLFNKARKYHKKSNPLKNYKNAMRWYKKAAEKGHTGAMTNIGVMYERGEGVERNLGQAVKWYKMAAKKGHVLAMYNLGVMHSKGIGIEKDYLKAIKWYKMAAKKGDTDAMNNIGVIYERGDGVTQSYDGAVKWYREAAEKGHAGAMANLGRMYENGGGVEKNNQQAIKWYQKAAKQNHPSAIASLGYMYEHGIGVSKDMKKAITLYRKAAKLGNQFAKKSLSRLK